MGKKRANPFKEEEWGDMKRRQNTTPGGGKERIG